MIECVLTNKALLVLLQFDYNYMNKVGRIPFLDYRQYVFGFSLYIFIDRECSLRVIVIEKYILYKVVENTCLGEQKSLIHVFFIRNTFYKKLEAEKGSNNKKFLRN